jgi:leucyl aminopeptidase (aminopeptidase T)
MAFNLEKLFVDVFAPQTGDILTIIYDLPHDTIQDNDEWLDRRRMADEWHAQIASFSKKYGMSANPVVTYSATGSNNADMPEFGTRSGDRVRIEEIVARSTIIISMPEFSASAPLMRLSQKYTDLRAASMPGVSRAMQCTSLAADYNGVAAICAQLAPLFAKADGIEVLFSTGHVCYFDISNHGRVFEDNAILHPGAGMHADRVMNLPSGEVCTCPNESKDSSTAGEIPAVIDKETIVLVIQANQIVGVHGEGPIAEKKRREFTTERALCNIAEVAIGCNDKAVVTGNVLEDEKAGFHWAFGRSDFLGGKVGVEDFSSPDKVYHGDIVYAKGSPIVCKRLEFIFSNGTRMTAITDGVLSI